MRSRALLLWLSILLILVSIPPAKSDNSPILQVTAPRCLLSGDIPLSANQDFAEVNVTSTYPIVNGTFYYEFVPQNHTGPPPVQSNLSQYDFGFMYSSGSNGTLTLSYQIPNPKNNTVAFGFAKVVDTHGNVAYSNGQPYPFPTCYFSSAAPKASLNMEMSVLDINPRYLNMTLGISATVTNSITFAPITLVNLYTTPSFIQVNQSQSSGYYIYGSGRTTESILPYGIAQLYPLDSYDYYMQFQSQQVLNFTSMSLNGVQLTPNKNTPDVVNYSLSATVTQDIDNSAWSLTSTAQFTPRVGNQLAYLTITLHITRSSSEVEYPILIPLLSLYTLLSVSLLATRKDDLANRLLVYISIFIFSYGFLDYVNTLIPSPVATGSNMVELLILALVPCTALLAGFSIVRWVPWVREHRDIADIADLAGITLATIALWVVAQFNLLRYEPVSGVYKLVPVSYTLFSLSWFGYALLLLFAMGSCYPIARIILRRGLTTRFLLRRRLRHNSGTG